MKFVGEETELFEEYKRKMKEFLHEKETQIYAINQELENEY